jgi:hypothetical protein
MVVAGGWSSSEAQAISRAELTARLLRVRKAVAGMASPKATVARFAENWV